MAAALDLEGLDKALGIAGRKDDQQEPEQQAGALDLKGLDDAVAAMNRPSKKQAAASQEEPGVIGAAKRFLGRRIGEIVGLAAPSQAFKTEVLPAVAAAADVPASLPGMVAGESAYWTRRGLGDQPEQAQAISQQVSGAVAQPVGRMFGVEGEKGYQEGAIPEAMGLLSQGISAAAKFVSEKTGMSPQDAEHAIQTGAIVLPEAMRGMRTPYETAPSAEAAKGWRPGEIAPTMPSEAPAAPAPTVAQTAGHLRSVGAAQTPTAEMVQAALQTATPELQQALSKIPPEQMNLPVMERHLEADSLPYPVRLSEGQATADPILISKEQNLRGKHPEYAERFNKQNGELINNLNAIGEQSAPDAWGSKKIESSQAIIDAYKAKDSALKTDIDAKYQALRDAAGGELPIDAQTLLSNVQQSLKKQLLTNDAPASQFGELQRLAKDDNMTFEDFLSLRKNLGNVARTAQDGNVRTAASIMIDEIEKLPLKQETAELKSLADIARSSAKNRFDLIKKDPAYKAAIEDKTPANAYFNKYVINGVDKNIQTMIDNLADDARVRDHLTSGAITWLRDRAGITEQGGNFSAANYNKALKQLEDSNNLDVIFSPETGTHLRTLGNVAHYTTYQPRGSFVNNSNTLVGAMAAHAAGLAEHVANVAGAKVGSPVAIGSAVRSGAERMASKKDVRRSLEVGAGTRLSDVGKK